MGSSTGNLLVDDEPMVLKVETRVLRRAGYDVDAHGDVDAVLSALAADSGGYAALVTDRTMPRLSGLEIARLARELNPRLAVAGMLLTMHDGRTRLARDVEREVREHFPELVFDTVIPRNVRIGEAPSFGRAVIHHDPHCAGADAYFELAKEVAARG